MNVPIFIRCYNKDADWLRYCLRSIRKFASRFSETVVTVPSRDHAIFAPMQAEFGFRLDEYDVRAGKEMIHGELRVCHSDELCPSADSILYLDPDCIAREPFSPEDYLFKGKPILVGIKFSKYKDSDSETERCQYAYWRPAIQAALGFEPLFETNCRVPSIFLRETFKPFREAIEKHTGMPFDEYAFSCQSRWPQTFIEFGPLGNWILKNTPEKYAFFDKDEQPIQDYADGKAPIWNQKFKQYWSHGGLKEEIKDYLEEILK